MRVLVCGGRQFKDQALVFATLNAIHAEKEITTLIEGGACGADAIGYLWALTYGVATSRYNAEWNKYGKRAGPVRNQQMIDEGHPDLVLAFPSPDSIGTKDMVARAKAANIETRVLS